MNEPDLIPAADEKTVLIPEQGPSFAWLVELGEPRRGHLHALDPGEMQLGRAQENDIVLEDESISRFHARCYSEPGERGRHFFVQDLASANGVFVNGERVVQRELVDDDHLRLGAVEFAFKQLQRPPS